MAVNDLNSYNPRNATRYDPGEVRIYYDNRTFGGFEDKLATWQSYYLQGLSYLNRPSIWLPSDLVPGNLRLIFYTHVGNEGKRDYPLHKWEAVKEMFDSLSEEGFRPMIIGYSKENPFPMLGGVEPAPPPKRKEPKRATTWSGAVSGHSSKVGETPHDRVMAIIRAEEEREAKARQAEVEDWERDKESGMA